MVSVLKISEDDMGNEIALGSVLFPGDFIQDRIDLVGDGDVELLRLTGAGHWCFSSRHF